MLPSDPEAIRENSWLTTHRESLNDEMTTVPHLLEFQVRAKRRNSHRFELVLIHSHEDGVVEQGSADMQHHC